MTIYSRVHWQTRPAEVFDANGDEIKYVISCDTETGAVERFATDHDGRLRVSANGQELVRVTEFAEAPLKLNFLYGD